MAQKPSDEEIFVRCFVSFLTNKENLVSYKKPTSIADVVLSNKNKVVKLIMEVQYNEIDGQFPSLSASYMLSPSHRVANDEVGGDDAA